MKVQYRKGDATNPVENGPKLIIHCCNNIGKWGKGFVLALSAKWPQTRSEYIKWSKHMAIEVFPYELGNVQFVNVEKDLWVGNMIGQEGIGSKHGMPPIRYSAIVKCLWQVKDFCKIKGCQVVCPKFGAGLAGGDFSIIETYLQDILCNNDIPVTVYEF